MMNKNCPRLPWIAALLALLIGAMSAGPCTAKETPTPSPVPKNADAPRMESAKGDAEEGPATEQGRAPTPLLTQEQFAEILNTGPAGDAISYVQMLKLILAALGLLFLVQWRRTRERRASLEPDHEVLAPLDLGNAVWLFLGLLFVPAFLLLLLGHSPDDPLIERRAREFAAVFAIGLPIVTLTIMRRTRLSTQRLPSWRHTIRLAFRGLCVATFFMIGAALLSSLLLSGFGREPRVQRLVQEGLTSSTVSWMVAVFGILIAPLVEEALFRGLLYPAGKKALGGVVQSPALVSALIVSAAFAVIHANVTAFAPLFALAMVLAWVMETTNSLAACVLIHAMNNVIAATPQILHHVL